MTNRIIGLLKEADSSSIFLTTALIVGSIGFLISDSILVAVSLAYFSISGAV